jgi:hypothetical protein
MMSDLNNGISRRSVLKGAAVGGLGIAAGGSLLAGCGSKATGPLAYGARSVDAGRTTSHSTYREHLTILLSGWLDTACSSSQSRVCLQI